jgi:hypothetical protein
MKLDKSQNYDDPYQDDCDGQLMGNPIIIILVVLILVLFTMVFSSSISKAANTNGSVRDHKQSLVKDWQPPVTPKVVLPPMVDAEHAREIADIWGVELISLRLTAGGYMIDFRFRILDSEKAGLFFDHKIKPLLVVERSNAKLPIPMASKVGAFRTTNRGKNIRSNKTYYMVFGNPDSHVKSGEKVTMVIGDFKAEHLIVH